MPIGNIEALTNNHHIEVEYPKNGEPATATCTCGESTADDDVHRVLVWSEQHEWRTGHALLMGRET